MFLRAVFCFKELTGSIFFRSAWLYKEKFLAIHWISSKKLFELKTNLEIYAHLDGETTERVIIAAHGFGDNAKNFSHLMYEFKLKNTLWIFPQGPKEIPMSYGGFQWFSLYENPAREIEKSGGELKGLFWFLKEELKISSEYIFYMGFSQGASMALFNGLLAAEPIGGIVALSGFIINQTEVLKQKEQLDLDCPIFLAHGNQDQVVFPAFHHESKTLLKYLGFKNILTKIYQMGHTINQEEISDIVKFIKGSRS